MNIRKGLKLPRNFLRLIKIITIGTIKKTLGLINEISKISSKYGKLVYDDGEYQITIDYVRDGVHVLLLKKGRQVGLLNVSIRKYNNEYYYDVRGVNINHEHRSKGYGTKMYKYLFKNRQDKIKGFLSKKNRIANKKEIPRIYNQYNTTENEDYVILNFNSNNI